jgi:hypothetical protein
LALTVPLSRFTSRVGGGSAFYVRPHSRIMYFADLTPCSYSGIREPNGIGVGWLDKAHDFSRGAVSPGFVERLLEICKTPAVMHRGFHVCEFCCIPYDPTYKKTRDNLSSVVIRVIGSGGQVYYSPAMICHYVSKHDYKPPEDFVRAVMQIDLPMWPNKSPEPTAVGAVNPLSRAALSVRRWLSFFR